MPRSSVKISVVASALANDPRQSPAIASKIGFGGLLFEAFSQDLNISDLSVTGRREFRHLLTSQEGEIVGFQADLGAKGFGIGADVDRLLWQSQKILEAAAGLGSPLISLDIGPLPEPARETKANPKITQEQAGLILLPTFSAAPAPEVTDLQSLPMKVDPIFVAQVDGALAELGALADRYSVMIAFRSELASFAALNRALSAARCPWFGIEFDPVNALRDAWPLDEIFSRFGPLIRHVRARDALLGADRRTKPAVIGKGNVNWNELFSNLEGAAYQGWITVDPLELTDRISAATAGLKSLRAAAQE